MNEEDECGYKKDECGWKRYLWIKGMNMDEGDECGWRWEWMKKIGVDE